jgi:hypothetical protein
MEFCKRKSTYRKFRNWGRVNAGDASRNTPCVSAAFPLVRLVIVLFTFHFIKEVIMMTAQEKREDRIAKVQSMLQAVLQKEPEHEALLCQNDTCYLFCNGKKDRVSNIQVLMFTKKPGMDIYSWPATPGASTLNFLWICQPSRSLLSYKAAYYQPEDPNSALLFGYKGAYTEDDYPEVLMAVYCLLENNSGVLWIASTMAADVQRFDFCPSPKDHSNVVASVIDRLTTQIKKPEVIHHA